MSGQMTLDAGAAASAPLADGQPPFQPLVVFITTAYGCGFLFKRPWEKLPDLGALDPGEICSLKEKAEILHRARRNIEELLGELAGHSIDLSTDCAGARFNAAWYRRRNFSWSEFPLTDAFVYAGKPPELLYPAIEQHRLPGRPELLFTRKVDASASEALRRAKHVVFLDPGTYPKITENSLESEMAWLHGALRCAGVADIPIHIIKTNDQGAVQYCGVSSPESRWSALKDEYLPAERFRWNYAINFSAIIGPALLEVIRVFPHNAERDAVAREQVIGSMPLAHLADLQALYKLWRQQQGAGIEPIDAHTTDRFPMLRHAGFSSCMVIRQLLPPDLAGQWNGIENPDEPWRGIQHEEHRLVPAWVGSGRYPPLMATGADITCRYRLTICASGLLHLGLIDYDPVDCRKVRVTKRGDAFLRMLPRQMEDPDLVLRWRDPATGRWTGTREATEKWLLRIFRKAKRDLGHLPRKAGR